MLNPAQPGHNRSGSPSATLADITERKVPKHGSQANPTIDPRHDSELMHIYGFITIITEVNPRILNTNADDMFILTPLRPFIS